MQATKKDLKTLSHLQECDLEILRTQKRFDELPQRKSIIGLREKLKTVEGKKTQVEDLLKQARNEFQLISNEDERLAQKQHDIQEKISTVQGDYRSVEAHTKELGGIAKRRNTLEAELAPLSEKMSQIESAAQQLKESLAQLRAQEAQAVGSFRKEGGQLNEQLAKLKAKRAQDAVQLDAALLALYEKKAQRMAGVALAHLAGQSCSVCRNSIDEGKFFQIKAEAPLSECPFCHRMLVVADA